MKPITSLAEKSNPNAVYTKQKQNKLQQTKHRGVYQKKKSPIHKLKPNPNKPNPVTHDHVSAARLSSSSSLAPHRRSQILDRRLQISWPLFRCSVLLLALHQGISLFFSLTLSQSLSLFISLKWKNEMKFSQIVDRSSEIANCSASALVQRCSLLPPAVRPSLKVFLSDSLSVSLSLSHWMKKWNEIYERVFLFIL